MLVVFVGGLGLATTLYITVALCGYTTFGNNVAANVLVSYPVNPLTDIARVGLSLVVIFSYPLQALTLRTSAASLYLTCRGLCGGGTGGAEPSPPPSPPDDAEAEAASGRSSLAASPAPTSKIAISSRPSEKFPLALDDAAADVSPSAVSVGWAGVFGSFELRPLYALPTLALIGVTAAVGFSLTSISIIVDLSGSLGATSIAFIAPPFMYFRLKRDSAPPLLPGIALFVFVFGWFILISGLTFVGISGS